VNASYGAFQNWMTMTKKDCSVLGIHKHALIKCIAMCYSKIRPHQIAKGHSEKIEVVLKSVCLCLLFYTFLRFFEGTNTSYGLNQYMLNFVKVMLLQSSYFLESSFYLLIIKIFVSSDLERVSRTNYNDIT
jgi:hypothetical protein